MNGSALKTNFAALTRVECWSFTIRVTEIGYGTREVATVFKERRHVVTSLVGTGVDHVQMRLNHWEESCSSCDGGESELHF